jgi:hypothetical protein
MSWPIHRAAIVETDFIILCFLPAEVELASQALNAWGYGPPPPFPRGYSPSTSDSQLPYQLHHQIINLDTLSCNNVSGERTRARLLISVALYCSSTGNRKQR